ncbi:hypothetical protein [Alteribacter keqinensis]|uniref:Uncharacterized protein n=1 Tax=Alteribacter keqinensis TaxID=2483800 RepID=A0A3M7TR28_9BACI|nr:hypothetical protein [Alteribacter keqinensis]RNA67717.1 hypothetical protein EBO34_13450 [Alteribacter keqinensis]
MLIIKVCSAQKESYWYRGMIGKECEAEAIGRDFSLVNTENNRKILPEYLVSRLEQEGVWLTISSEDCKVIGGVTTHREIANQ